MKWHERVHLVLCVWWLDLTSLPRKIRRRIWNKHLLLWWHRLYTRKDEFHCSLEMDAAAVLEMNEQERKKYIADLIRRREKVHQRDLAKR